MSKKLFLLDGMALIYRAYFGFSNNHRINSKGLNTSAIFGFTNTLLEVLRKENPTHIAVVFDTSGPTARHEEFPAYKAHREEMPEDLAKSIPYIYRLCECFCIPLLTKVGYEADDIIGTLAVKAEKEGYDTYMMEVCKRWDIERVEQVKDILGLMGDASDNIPGIPGVGEKTAIQLVKQFGSIENLLQNTDQLKGKLKEKVELNKEMAIQSKRLATILLDVPVNDNINDLVACEPDKEKLRELFTELEFRRLAEQLNLSNAPAEPGKSKPVVIQASQTSLFGNETNDTVVKVEIEEVTEAGPEKDLRTIHTTEHKYFLANSPEERKKLIGELLKQKSICFDTETTGIDAGKAELVGISFSSKVHEGWYVPVPPDRKEAEKIVAEFKPVFENEKIEKIAQNLKYDLAILTRYGVKISGPTFDTMIAHFLIQPEMRHNMDIMSETYLSYSPVSIETLIGKKERTS